MITVFLILLAVLYAVNIIATITIIGKPRKAVTPRQAAFTVAVNGAFLAGFIAAILER